jgi:hypothetical protein
VNGGGSAALAAGLGRDGMCGPRLFRRTGSDAMTIVPQARDLLYTGQRGSTTGMRVTKTGNRLRKDLIGRITVGVNLAANPALIGIHA